MAYQPTAAHAETLKIIARSLLGEVATDDLEAVLDAVWDQVGNVSAADRADLERLLSLFDQPVWVLALGGHAKRLASHSVGDVTAILNKLATSRLTVLRSMFHALRKIILVVAWALPEQPRVQATGYPGPRTDRLAAVLETPLVVTPLAEVPTEVDVVIVGSGPGGSVAAALFAAGGKKVLVLEQGEYATQSTRDQREMQGLSRLYLDGGTTTTRDLGVTILAGKALGGGSVVNWSASLRMSGPVAQHWDETSGLKGLGASLEPHYDAVSARLGLETRSDNQNNHMLAEGARRLGLPMAPIPRNAPADCGSGCGYCSFGCAYGKKRDMTRTYLRDAQDAGAILVTGAKVERVEIAHSGGGIGGAVGKVGRVIGVVVESAGKTKLIRARTVVMAAGALRTPNLLQQSGINHRSHPTIGQLYLHPTSITLGRFDTPIKPWEGSPMTAVSRAIQHRRGSFGALLEVAPVHPGLGAAAIPFRDATQHHTAMKQIANTAFALTITRDRDPGRIRLENGRSVIDYKVSRFDGQHLLEGIVQNAEILLAAGAREVGTTHVPIQSLRREQATARAIRQFGQQVIAAGHAPHHLALFSAHQMGSARMHARSSHGVIDERGQVHGVRGLLVVDASAFPAASGVNPMLTILAMARRIAHLHVG